MKQRILTAKTYIIAHRKEFLIGITSLLCLVIVIIAILLFVQNSTPKVTYQPVNACDLLTPTEAKELLGDKTITSTVNTPIVLENTATSRCGYTDGNPDLDNMVVAAVIVRSGVNDKGVQQNEKEFIAGWPSANVETVKDIGDSAYFNHTLGQLNILNEHEWIIISYGPGSAPEANVASKAIELAHKLLDKNEV